MFSCLCNFHVFFLKKKRQAEETVNDIRSSLPRVTIRHSSAPSSRTRSSDAFSPGKGRRRVNSSITGGSIVEEDEGGLPLYYDPLSGMEGSSIAYTDSTDLGPHMYTFDLASGESSLYDTGSQGDGPKADGDGGLDVVEDTHEELDDVEVLLVEGQGSTDLASVPHSSSNQIQMVVEDPGTNVRDHSAQYDFEVEALNNSGVGGSIIPSIRIGDGMSATNSVDMNNSAISSQPDPYSETEKFDAETSTTISEDLIEPSGVNKVDIKTISGVIPEEESVDVGFGGEGVHIPQGDEEVDEEVEEGELDWEEKGEEAAATEVDLARYGVIGEEDNGEGDEVEEGTDANNVSQKVESVHEKTTAPSPAQSTKSPALGDRVSSQRRASLAQSGSRASLKSTSPQPIKTPSPAMKQSPVPQNNQKSPSPNQKTGLRKLERQKSSSDEVSSPEVRGKNTPPFVTITKKISSQNLTSTDATKDNSIPVSQSVDSRPNVPLEKAQSKQDLTDSKSVKSEDALPTAPASSPVQRELDAPDSQQSQVKDGGAPVPQPISFADKSKKGWWPCLMSYYPLVKVYYT